MVILGICIGLLLAGCCFMIYYVIWNKNRPKCKKEPRINNSNSSPTGQTPLLNDDQLDDTKPKFTSINSQSTDPSSRCLTESATESSSELTTTTTTTSSSSYRPDIVL
jgi:hypothetical protein